MAAPVDPMPFYALPETAENCALQPLARLMLIVRRQGQSLFLSGSKTMAKFESFTFTLGIMLSSLLLVATMSPIT